MVIKRCLFKCHRIYLSPSCPRPRLLVKGKYKCSLWYRYVVRASVWVLQKKNRSRNPRWLAPICLTWKVGDNSLVWPPPEADGPSRHPPEKPRLPREARALLQTPLVQPGPKPSTQEPMAVCRNLFHSQMTGTECDYKNREHFISS